MSSTGFLSAEEIRCYYRNMVFRALSDWDLRRKHFRLETLNGSFVRLNRFENRISLEELRGYCVRYAPKHVFMSALNWLFPERVGRKCKANYAVPISGEYVVDVDSYLLRRPHNHHPCSNSLRICYGCLEISRGITINLCESIERYYSQIRIVFSGNRGFHIHVLDFEPGDWTYYSERNPIKSHEVARLRFTRLLALQSLGFNRSHFTLSVDPMRVLSVPWSLNARTGLRCSYIGGRKTLEASSSRIIVEGSKPIRILYQGHLSPHGR